MGKAFDAVSVRLEELGPRLEATRVDVVDANKAGKIAWTMYDAPKAFNGNTVSDAVRSLITAHFASLGNVGLEIVTDDNDGEFCFWVYVDYSKLVA